MSKSKIKVLHSQPCSVTGDLLTVEETSYGLRSINLAGHCQSDVQVLPNGELSKRQPLELVQIMTLLTLTWLAGDGDKESPPAAEIARVLLVGLGGGSIARALADTMAPGHSIHSVELEPEVLQAAIDYFGLQLSEGRCTAEAGDGARFIREHCRKCRAQEAAPYDVLLLDAFTSEGLSASTQQCKTLDDAKACLSASGLLVVNLHTGDSDDPDYAAARRMLRALCARFDAVYSVQCVSTLNLIAICHQGELVASDAWAARMEAQFLCKPVTAACGNLSLDETLSRLQLVGGREHPMSDDEIDCGTLPP